MSESHKPELSPVNAWELASMMAGAVALIEATEGADMDDRLQYAIWLLNGGVAKARALAELIYDNEALLRKAAA